MNPNYKKYEVVDLLKEIEVTIRFTKTDGTVRDLRCTLNQELIPAECIPDEKGKKTKKENDDIVTVFDLDSYEWRSIRLDSMISITV